MSHQLIATCAFGLEAVVKRELSELGYDSTVLQPGWVAFEGDENTLIESNLCLRSADRVLIQVAEFDASDFDTLFETTKALEWSRWIPVDGKFPVKGRSIQSQLSSVPACQRSVKRAVAESLQKGHGVNHLPEETGLFQIEIALRKDRARLTIDTTGPSLHKRGYRKLVGLAPLKETLAAAMVQLSVWNSDRAFIDPFCGSGTIAIEAALIATKIAPGLQRQFSSEQWPSIDKQLWEKKREELKQVAFENRMNLEDRILATDIDAEVLGLARYHAKRAGVDSLIHFQQKSFEELRSKKEFGCLITNPPYGERLQEKDMIRFYQSIPRVLQRLSTWSHFILTAFPRFEAVIQKSATRRRKLFNGRIECMYYQYLGPKPPKSSNKGQLPDTDQNQYAESDELPDHTPSTAPALTSNVQSTEPDKRVNEEESSSVTPTSQPVFGGLSERVQDQAKEFDNRLRKRARHLRRWPKRGITCYRVYDRDIPEIPWSIDRYEKSLHIVEYDRPHDRDLAAHASWQDLMCKTAAKSLETEIQNVYFKTKSKQLGKRQHDRLATEKSEIVVQEGGLIFLVNLSDYVDTGLFLDHRITRERFREEAKEKRVLNLFGYTGAFTVYAADGGAKSVVHVDASRTYVDWAKRNMSINKFHEDRFVYRVVDVNQFFLETPEQPLFDLAIVDPPTFSNSKKSEAIWDIQRDHDSLLAQLKKRMAKNGVIYFSTNFRRFKLNESIADQFASVREISKQTVPEDFRNKRIHRCWRIEL